MAQHYGMKRVKTTLALTHGAGVTTVTSPAVGLNGLLHEAIIVTPATVDGAATATINVIDSDSVTVYSKSAIAVNTTVADLLVKNATYTAPIPLSGNYTVQVVFSANQTVTDSTTAVTLMVAGN